MSSESRFRLRVLYRNSFRPPPYRQGARRRHLRRLRPSRWGGAEGGFKAPAKVRGAPRRRRCGARNVYIACAFSRMVRDRCAAGSRVLAGCPYCSITVVYIPDDIMSLYLRVKSVLYRMSQSPAGVRGGVATFESAHVDQLLLTRPVIVVYTCRIARPVVPRLGIQNTRLKRQTQTAGGAHASTRVEALKLAQVDVLLRAQT